MLKTETQAKVKTLAEAQSILRDIPNIHHGGCGIAALALSRWIKKSDLRASTLFVFGSDTSSIYKKNATAVIDRNRKPSSASHVGLIVYDYGSGTQSIIDSRGLYDMSVYPYLNVVPKEEFVVRSINEVDQWNSSFNRKLWVEQIAIDLDIDLSDIDLRNQYEYLTGSSEFISYKSEPCEADEMSEDMKLAKKAAMENMGIWGIVTV